MFYPSIVLGGLLIAFGSWDEFRRTIRRPKLAWRYYVAAGLLVVINLAVYLLLVNALLAAPSRPASNPPGDGPPAVVDAQQRPEFEFQVGPFLLEGAQVKGLLPLVLAVFYFAAGMGTFRLGTREINLNQRLIRLLQSMFSQHQMQPPDFGSSDLAAEKHYKELRQELDRIEVGSGVDGFDGLQEQLRDYKIDETLLNRQIDYLKTIRRDLGRLIGHLQGDAAVLSQLQGVVQNVHERIDALRQRLYQKLQKFLVAFAFKSYRDDAAIERFLVKIHVLPAPLDDDFKPPNLIARGLVMGFVCGLFFGPIFCKIHAQDPSAYCFLGATALMGFTGLITYGVQNGSWKKGVIWGSVGGYIIHLYWIIMEAFLKHQTVVPWSDPRLWKAPMLGLCLGVLTALYLILLKRRLNHLIRNDLMLYLVSALVGALSYPLVCMAMLAQRLGHGALLTTALVGALAMLAMALSVNVGTRRTAV